MSMSGVKMNQDCQNHFKEMQMKQKYRYLLFAIKDQKEIILAKSGGANQTFDDFLKALPPKDPCYALVDVDYTSKAGAKTAKCVFVFWTPDACTNVKDKMIYASSKDGIKKELKGIQLEVQGTELDDLKKAEIQDKLQKV